MSEYRLILVDDDDVFRMRLARAMEARQFEVRTACSVEEGKRVLESFSPTHALLDLKMPGESGLELVNALRSHASLCRILILTGFGSIPVAVEAIRRGVDDVLTKPMNADQIAERLLNLGCSVALTVEPPSLGRVEWEHLQRVLRDCGGNISQAARLLGIERRTLQRKLNKYPPSQ